MGEKRERRQEIEVNLPSQIWTPFLLLFGRDVGVGWGSLLAAPPTSSHPLGSRGAPLGGYHAEWVRAILNSLLYFQEGHLGSEELGTSALFLLFPPRLSKFSVHKIDPFHFSQLQSLEALLINPLLCHKGPTPPAALAGIRFWQLLASLFCQIQSSKACSSRTSASLMKPTIRAHMVFPKIYNNTLPFFSRNQGFCRVLNRRTSSPHRLHRNRSLGSSDGISSN